MSSSIAVESPAPPARPAPVFAGPSRYAVAAILLACGVTQLVAQLLELEEDDPATRVAYWAAHPTSTGVMMSLWLVSVPMFIGSVAALVALTRQSSRRLAWIGGGCMLMALTGLAAVLGLELGAYWRVLENDVPGATGVLASKDFGLPGVVLFAMFLGGALIGSLLLAVAMWRSPLLPRLTAVLLIAFVVVDMLLSRAQIGHLLNAAWSAVAAWAVLTAYVRRPRGAAQ
ncbi:MAG TPA: hypothetical protein VF462_07040 [Micromonosporaceae bacterium]